MILCPETPTDQFVRSLHDAGYNLVKLPLSSIRPLQLLAQFEGSNELTSFGEISDSFLAESQTLPPIGLDIRSTSFSGASTNNQELAFGLKLLGTVIGAMGGSKLGLDLKYKHVASVKFEFSDVMVNKIALNLLDQYLAQAKLNPFGSTTSELLEADRIYLISATLKSDKISVISEASDGSGVELSVPEIQGIVGGNVTVSGEATASALLSYAGDEPLIFAFQAVQLVYEDGCFKRLIMPTEPIALKDHTDDVALEDSREVGLLPRRGVFVQVRQPQAA